MLLIVGAVAVAAGLFALGLSILRLVGLARTQPLLRVPVVAEQTITLPVAGAIVLNIEGPHLTTKLAGLSYSLHDVARGGDVRLEPVVVRTRTSSLTRARLSVRRFFLDRPGPYRLRVAGIDPAASYADCGLVFTRPVSIALPIAVVAVVLAAATLIGGIVLVAGAGRETSADRDQIPLSALPEAPDSGGRQLRGDRAAAAVWREVRWAPGSVRLDVPSDWRARTNDAAVLDLRPADLTTFVEMKIAPAPAIAPEDFLRAARVQASSRLAGARIVGYAVRTLGTASGVLSFERSKGDTQEQLVWTGIIPGKNQLLTIFLGAARQNFAQAEPVLGAILDSIRIE